MNLDLPQPSHTQSALWNALFSSDRFYVYSKDLEGRFVEVNEVTARLFDRTPESMVGLTDAEILPEDFAKRIRRNDLEVMRTGKPLELYEIGCVNGSETFFDTIKFPIVNEKNIVVGLGGISIDRTEAILSQKVFVAEDEFEEQLSENPIPETIQNLLYSAIKDVTSPAHNLSLVADLLAKEPNSHRKLLNSYPLVKNLANRLNRSLNRIRQVITDTSISYENVELSKVYQQVERWFAQDITDYQVALIADVNADVKVNYPLTYIETIFSNLLQYFVRLPIDIYHKEVMVSVDQDGLNTYIKGQRNRIDTPENTPNLKKESSSVGLDISINLLEVMVQEIGGTFKQRLEKEIECIIEIEIPNSFTLHYPQYLNESSN